MYDHLWQWNFISWFRVQFYNSMANAKKNVSFTLQLQLDSSPVPAFLHGIHRTYKEHKHVVEISTRPTLNHTHPYCVCCRNSRNHFNIARNINAVFWRRMIGKCCRSLCVGRHVPTSPKNNYGSECQSSHKTNPINLHNITHPKHITRLCVVPLCLLNMHTTASISFLTVMPLFSPSPLLEQLYDFVEAQWFVCLQLTSQFPLSSILK